MLHSPGMLPKCSTVEQTLHFRSCKNENAWRSLELFISSINKEFGFYAPDVRYVLQTKHMAQLSARFHAEDTKKHRFPSNMSEAIAI